MEKAGHLSELEDASGVDVFSLVELHGRVFPELIQLQDGDPQLDPACHLIPPAETPMMAPKIERDAEQTRATLCAAGGLGSILVPNDPPAK